MIPVDLASRLRLLTEASFFQTDKPVHALNPAREIPADLPEFTPGQRLTATLDRPLADGLFRAVVVGKVVTLAIQTAPEDPPLSSGQTLALEVTRSTPQTLHAQIVPVRQDGGEAPPALSQAARLISTLLTGQPAQEPTALAEGKPLLPTPPSSAPPLIPALKEALTQSGMFYEAHQAQWLAGKRPLESLRQEPQGQLPPTPAPASTSPPLPAAMAPLPPGATPPQIEAEVAIFQNTPPDQDASAPPRPGPAHSGSLMEQARELFGLEPKANSEPASTAGTSSTTAAAPIPERILHLVGQQLDALATQQFVWHGQVWPGQTMEWEIEDPTGGQGPDGQEAPDWNTTLRLTMPQLGQIEARLKLHGSGVTIRLLAQEPAARATLAAEQATLARGLDGAHVPLLGLSVEPADGDQ